jgi:hypothetical protein
MVENPHCWQKLGIVVDFYPSYFLFLPWAPVFYLLLETLLMSCLRKLAARFGSAVWMRFVINVTILFMGEWQMGAPVTTAAQWPPTQGTDINLRRV